MALGELTGRRDRGARRSRHRCAQGREQCDDGPAGHGIYRSTGLVATTVTLATPYFSAAARARGERKR
jgi:hypothetical protein